MNTKVEMNKLPVRRRRTSADGLRDILTVANQDPNYVYRWVADDPNKPGRIRKLQELGYEVVTEDVQVGDNVVDKLSKVGSAVTRYGGGGVTLVLMRQRREWWEEDQKAKQAKVDALEQTMLREVESGLIPGSKEPAARGGRLRITRG